MVGVEVGVEVEVVVEVGVGVGLEKPLPWVAGKTRRSATAQSGFDSPPSTEGCLVTVSGQLSRFSSHSDWCVVHGLAYASRRSVKADEARELLAQG